VLDVSALFRKGGKGTVPGHALNARRVTLSNRAGPRSQRDDSSRGFVPGEPDLLHQAARLACPHKPPPRALHCSRSAPRGPWRTPRSGAPLPCAPARLLVRPAACSTAASACRAARRRRYSRRRPQRAPASQPACLPARPPACLPSCCSLEQLRPRLTAPAGLPACLLLTRTDSSASEGGGGGHLARAGSGSAASLGEHYLSPTGWVVFLFYSICKQTYLCCCCLARHCFQLGAWRRQPPCRAASPPRLRRWRKATRLR
jgi:hypothetical protein